MTVQGNLRQVLPPRFRAALVSALVCGVMMATAGCASAATRVYVRVGPPPPIVEIRAIAPGPRYVWINGYHRWDGRAYVWVPGVWVVPPPRRVYWVPAHWVRDRRGWYFVEGRWR